MEHLVFWTFRKNFYTKAEIVKIEEAEQREEAEQERLKLERQKAEFRDSVQKAINRINALKTELGNQYLKTLDNINEIINKHNKKLSPIEKEATDMFLRRHFQGLSSDIENNNLPNFKQSIEQAKLIAKHDDWSDTIKDHLLTKIFKELDMFHGREEAVKPTKSAAANIPSVANKGSIGGRKTKRKTSKRKKIKRRRTKRRKSH